jgi:transposase
VLTGAARGDLTRFDTPRERRPCFGLIPAEDASGERRRQGALPQAGQTQARRALGEGAWAERSPAHVRRQLQRRLAKQSKAIQDISGKAQGRLGKRYRCLVARGHQAPQVVGAMARALLGCRWAMAQQGPGPP